MIILLCILLIAEYVLCSTYFVMFICERLRPFVEDTIDKIHIEKCVYSGDCPGCEQDLIEYKDIQNGRIRYHCDNCGYDLEYRMNADGMWRKV